MADDRLRRLINRFATAAKAHHEALEVLDDVDANRHARLIAGLYDAIVREGEAGREGLLTLLDSRDDAVAGMVAVYSLSYRPERCVAVLRRIAAGEGLLAFRASVALQRWENGDWG